MIPFLGENRQNEEWTLADTSEPIGETGGLISAW